MKAVRWPPRSEPAKSHDFRPPEGSLGCVVGQAGAAVIEKAGEVRPSVLREHVVDRLGDGGVLRHPGSFADEPIVQLLDQRTRQPLPRLEPGVRGQPVHGALDVEERVDVA